MPANLAQITLKRTQSTWLYAWSANGNRFYLINQANVRYLAGSADFARNAFNAAILGLCVRVQGSYDKTTHILTIQP
jgi:hypothetical protein